jgi:hypothetical protein
VLGDALVASDAKKSHTPASGLEELDDSDYKWAVTGMLLIVLTSYFATAFNVTSSGTSAGGSLNGDGWPLQVFANAFSLAWFVTYEDKMAFVAFTVYILYCCIRIIVSALNCAATCGVNM